MLWRAGLVLLLCWGATGEVPNQFRDSPEHEDPTSDLQADSVTVGARQQRSPPPVEPLDFGFVPAAVYDTHVYYEPGPIRVLFHIVHAFLYLVQPNPFPKDLIVSAIQQNPGGIKLDDYRKLADKPENVLLMLQAIYYEAGFLVCVCLGSVFLLLTPVVGLCFCVCRCCDNCGGEMHQRQRKNADCQRSFYTAALIVTSILITFGVLIAHAANQNMTSQIKATRRFISTNMRDMKTLANNTPAQIDYLTAQYTTAKNKVLSDLDNIGPLLGGRIQTQLEKEVVPTLDMALRTVGVKVENAIKAMRETKEALESVSSSLEVLQEGTSRLAFRLALERTSLSNTLSDPACSNGAVSRTCNNIRSTLKQLETNGNFSGLPDVSPQLASLDIVMKADLSDIIQKGYSSFNDTPRMVQDQTKNVVSALPRVKAMLDKIGGEIVGFSKMFPVEPSLVNFTIFLNLEQKKMEANYPKIDEMDFNRWIGGVALLCTVVLVLAFNFLGLLCGTCGYDKQATPTTRGCLSNTGGNLLMAGVAFSFLFLWWLMGFVSAGFVFGGNVEKLICEPLANKELFKVIDTPYMVHPAKKNFLPALLFQKPNMDLTVGSLYRDCSVNSGLYHALQLETMFKINTFLNTTVYNKDLAKVFEGVKIDLHSMMLLEQEGRDSLLTFSNTGIGELNYAAYLAEVNKGVTLVDLLAFANELEAQADLLPRGALENALKGHASSIRQIHREQVIPVEQAMSTLSQSIRLLQRTAKELPVKVTNILSAIDAAEYLITHNASHVVKQETDAYMNNMIGYFRQYTKWVKDSLEGEVAQCKPISNIIDTMELVACSFIFDSLNTFWFGLGGSCVFLVLSIIISVKLAKYYRRMDTEDVFDDGQENW
ncbi:prominin 1 b isoform X3 [Esox lucius]|uniref:prominin 1 b isoform X3 n=1 Tax=Esox lucius TaxID=8010 RepID=UPI001476AEEB|nr:prominin 1 b isoform X3 [Esox lucius]